MGCGNLNKEDLFRFVRNGFLFEIEEVEKKEFQRRGHRTLDVTPSSMTVEIGSKKFKIEVTEEIK